jgi:hypothetical protein
MQPNASYRRIGRRARVVAVGAAIATMAGLFTGSAIAQADTAPAAGVPATVSADALPTAQINGVVWAQATVGNTVYAVGDFSKARPAGSAVGTNEVSRAGILAYDITTGALISSFNHSLNGQGLAIAASPDGTRVYIGGDFTTVDGIPHGHVAAFSTATGALDPNFTAQLNGTARALAATNTGVYVGGLFTLVNGQPQTNLTQITASTGAVTAWSAPANDTVRALILTPDQSKLVVGGRFTQLSGVTEVGFGAVNAATGATVPWASQGGNYPIRDSGDNSSISSFTTDGTVMYGSGYQSSGGNFEGRWAFSPADGSVIWINDCHGDTYSTYATAGVVYSVGHAHDCAPIGAFPQPTDTPTFWKRALAETTAASAANNTGPDRYGWNYSAYKHSTQLDWYPTLAAGTFTGMSQAGWSVTGNGDYVAIGGEFPTVNGVAQQGLVRFAVRAIAPNKVGATYAQSARPTVVYGAGSATVSWQASWDMDNEDLTYRVYRDGAATPVYVTTQASTFWNVPTMSFTDTGLPSGYQPNYRVTVTDPLGNVASYSQPYNDTDSRWAYAGTWSAGSGIAADDWSGDVHRTSSVGASAAFSFTGTAVTPYVEKSSTGAVVSVAIDGTVVDTVDTTKATATGFAALGPYSGLANGTHTLTLTLVSGTLALDAVSYAGSGLQTATPVTPVTLNDADAAFGYQGSAWYLSTARGFGDYQDDVHASSKIGDTVTLTWTGTGITVYGEKYTDQGLVGVTLDGVAQANVNTTANPRQAQAPIVTFAGLSPGTHTLTLTHLTGTYMTIDKAVLPGGSVVLAPVLPPLPPITLNDTATTFGYRGAWYLTAKRGLGDYQDDVHASPKIGDTVTITWTGTGITVYGEKYTDQGLVGVTLDGVAQANVNTTANPRQVQAPIVTLTGLAAGTHTLTLTHLTGTYMTIDKAVLPGGSVVLAPVLPPLPVTVNDTATAFGYRGAWYLTAKRGLGDYQDDVHASPKIGDTVTVTWTGTGITVYGEKYTDQGLVGVTLDGVAQANVNTTANPRQVQAAIVSFAGLSAGTHTLTLTHVSGTYMTIDKATTS